MTRKFERQGVKKPGNLESIMTAFTTITINNAAAVAKTFTARRIDNGVAKWQDISGGIAVGYPTITASLREPIRGSKNPSYKATLKIVAPKLEVVNASTYNGITPAPTKAYDIIVNIDVIIPERSVTLDRQDAIAFAKNAMAQADIKAMLEDLNFVF